MGKQRKINNLISDRERRRKKARIYKDGIVCWFVIEKPNHDKKNSSDVRIEPATMEWDFGSNSIELEDDEAIISIIPSVGKNYLVRGEVMGENGLEREDQLELGIEIEGATHPDWIDFLLDEDPFSSESEEAEKKANIKEYNKNIREKM